MRTFSGRLWLIQDRHSEVGVEVSLDEERMRITSNGTVIGDWAFDDVDIKRRGENIHVFAEDEEVIISSAERGFADAMLKPARGAAWRRSGRPEPENREPPSTETSEQDDTTPRDKGDGGEEQQTRRRSRRGSHREPWSLKLRW